MMFLKVVSKSTALVDQLEYVIVGRDSLVMIEDNWLHCSVNEKTISSATSCIKRCLISVCQRVRACLVLL